MKKLSYHLKWNITSIVLIINLYLKHLIKVDGPINSEANKVCMKNALLESLHPSLVEDTKNPEVYKMCLRILFHCKLLAVNLDSNIAIRSRICILQ